MNAGEIARALGEARREGSNWRCRCPLHGGWSLSLRDGDAGRLLVTCWGGCNRSDVLAELRRAGFLDKRDGDYRPRLPATSISKDNRRIASCLSIWRKAQPPANSIVATYLASRQITLDVWPESLCFHPRCPRPKDDGNLVYPLPAMVALVEHVQYGPVAVHCTYLRQNGAGKADLPKDKQRAFFGPVAGGAVRLAKAQPDRWLVVGEGIETTLSVMQACAIPGWAALSEGGIKNLILPPDAAKVLICADNDHNGTGQRAARAAAERFLREGRNVQIAMPPIPGTDFNDLLRLADVGRLNEEARDVA
jgi:putative DNA primase/helicase